MYKFITLGLAYKKSTTFVGVLLLACLLPGLANGASYFLSPGAGTYDVGETVSVGIYVASKDSAVNAVSGSLTFPEDLVQVVSLSKNQSIVSLWVQEPTYSNTAGTIQFEGIALNPGYTGSQGKVLTVTLRIKGAGKADIRFANGSILANDGLGTELLTASEGGSFTLVQEQPQIEREVTEDTSVPEVVSDIASATVGVTSLTHPHDEWVSRTSGTFLFSFEPEVSALRLLLDTEPTSQPTVIYTPPIASRDISDIPEGVSYLHVQAKDTTGWGKVTHHMIRVDTQPPQQPKVALIPQKGVDTGNAIFTIDGIDQTDEVQFEVQVDAEVQEKLEGGLHHVYVTPVLSDGSHTLTVTAIDRAGNRNATTVSFTTVATSAGEVDKEVTVQENPWYTSGTMAITVLSVVIPFMALILVLVGILIAGYRMYKKYTRGVSKEVIEAKQLAHNAFAILKSDLQEDIVVLEKANKKRKLTKEEAKILKRLKLNIDQAESVIDREIDDIAKVPKGPFA